MEMYATWLGAARENRAKLLESLKTVLLGNTDKSEMTDRVSCLMQETTHLPVNLFPVEWDIADHASPSIRIAIRTALQLKAREGEIRTIARDASPENIARLMVCLDVARRVDDLLMPLAKELATPALQDSIATKEKMIGFGVQAKQEIRELFDSELTALVASMQGQGIKIQPQDVEDAFDLVVATYTSGDFGAHLTDTVELELLLAEERAGKEAIGVLPVEIEHDEQPMPDESSSEFEANGHHPGGNGRGLVERNQNQKVTNGTADVPSSVLHTSIAPSDVQLRQTVSASRRRAVLPDLIAENEGAVSRHLPLSGMSSEILHRPVQTQLDPFPSYNAEFDIDAEIVARTHTEGDGKNIDKRLSGESLADRLFGTDVEKEIENEPECIKMLSEAQAAQLINFLGTYPDADELGTFFLRFFEDTKHSAARSIQRASISLAKDPPASIKKLQHLVSHVSNKKEVQRQYVHPGTLRRIERHRLLYPNLRAIIETHFERCPKPPSERRLLDIGAWDGHTAEYLEDLFSYTVAVEASMTRYHQLEKKKSPTFETVFGNIGELIDSLEFEPQPDVALLSHVLYFLKERDRDTDKEVLEWTQDNLNRDGISISVLNDLVGEPGSRAHLRKTLAGSEVNSSAQRYVEHLERQGYSTQVTRPTVTLTTNTNEGLSALREMMMYLLPENARNNPEAIDHYIDSYIRDRGGKGVHTFDHSLFILVARAKDRLPLRSTSSIPKVIHLPTALRV